MVGIKQRDLTKLIKAAKAAGLPVSRIAYDRAGRVQLFTDGENASRLVNEWDAVL